ncbi:MAG: hypothetical protein AAGA56_27910 [Myxococcota bacterium]
MRRCAAGAGGAAYVAGYAEVDANARPTAAMCSVDGSGAWLGRQLGDVYLMRDIVRTDCKRACIADGACDEPTHEDGLTFTRYENRARLCAWLGGRIPNLWELARAARGDAIAPAGEELMSTYFACFDQTLAAGALNGVSDTCAELFGELWANQASPLELLHGPWGHEGLYVGAEVSSSVVPAAAFEPGTGLVNFCRDTPQDAGVDAEGRRIDFDPAASLIRIWERLGTPRTFFRDPGYRGPGNNPTFAWRCAFDPPEE